MRVIQKNDLMFKLIQLGIIFLIGIFVVFYSKTWMAIPFALGFIIMYVFFSFRKIYKRYRLKNEVFLPEWENFLSEQCPFYRKLSQKGKKMLEGDMHIVLSEVSIIGIKDFAVDWKIKLLVACGIAIIIHGWQNWEIPLKDGVVVYPGETFDEDFRVGQGNIAGSARQNSPLLVTENMLKQGFSDSKDGFNPLLHELAHYFDFENTVLEGIPLIGNDQKKITQWRQIMEAEKKMAGQDRSFLRPYAGTNDAEFFAVATEAFFEIPEIIVKYNPELYRVLKEFYNLDTLEILSRPLGGIEEKKQ